MLVYQRVNEWTGGVLETRGLRFRRVAGRRMLIFLFRTNLCWGAGVLNLPWLIIMPYFSPSISFQSIHTTRIAVQSFQPFIFQQQNLQQKGDEKYYLWNFGSRMFGIFSCNYWSNRWFWVIYWAGVLVGPIGLRLIIDEHEIATMSLGLHARMNGPWDSNWI